MANLDLSKYGIKDVKEIIHNPSYDVLFAEETKPGLEGFEKGQVTELGAVNVMTGIYTGRSPKDKFFVMNEASKDSVWWTSEEYKNDNKPCSEEAWEMCIRDRSWTACPSATAERARVPTLPNSATTGRYVPTVWWTSTPKILKA